MQVSLKVNLYNNTKYEGKWTNLTVVNTYSMLPSGQMMTPNVYKTDSFNTQPDDNIYIMIRPETAQNLNEVIIQPGDNIYDNI